MTEMAPEWAACKAAGDHDWEDPDADLTACTNCGTVRQVSDGMVVYSHVERGEPRLRELAAAARKRGATVSELEAAAREHRPHPVDPTLPWGSTFQGPDPLTVRRMTIRLNLPVHLGNEHRIDPDKVPPEQQAIRHALAHLYGQFRPGQEHYHTDPARPKPPPPRACGEHHAGECPDEVPR